MFRALVLFALAAAAIVAGYGEVSAAMRLPLTLPFLLAGPGLAWSGGSKDRGIAELAVMAVGLTLAMETTIGTLLLLCGLWSPQTGFGMLLAATAAGLLCNPGWRRLDRPRGL